MTEQISGSWISDRRATRGLSQEDVAQALKVSQGTVSNWERGKTSPDEVQEEALKQLFLGEPVETGEIDGLEKPHSNGWGEQYPLDAVFVRTEQRTVGEVVKRIRAERYDLSPDFQRMFVWGDEKQSRLIESCLMRIPLPVLYVAEAPDGKIIVVDGLQRLSTFRRFLNNELKLTFSRSEDEQPHSLEGKNFGELDLKLQERIEDTQLTLYILDPKAPERAKLDIFERVNNGEPLTRQQMRNCLYNGPATRWLAEAADSTLFKRATGDSLDHKKMRDREAINRFCAFQILGWREYRSADMDGFLASALEKMNRSAPQLLLELRQSFDRSMAINEELFQQHAFRKSILSSTGNRTLLNIALFDVLSVMFSDIHPAWAKEKEDDLRDAILNLMRDPEFEHSISASTNSRKPVQTRFQRMEEMKKEVLR